MCQILLRIQVETERAHWIQKSLLSEEMCRNTTAYGGKNGEGEVNTGGCI